jgi:hypothetical protein
VFILPLDFKKFQLAETERWSGLYRVDEVLVYLTNLKDEKKVIIILYICLAG